MKEIVAVMDEMGKLEDKSTNNYKQLEQKFDILADKHGDLQEQQRAIQGERNMFKMRLIKEVQRLEKYNL